MHVSPLSYSVAESKSLDLPTVKSWKSYKFINARSQDHQGHFRVCHTGITL